MPALIGAIVSGFFGNDEIAKWISLIIQLATTGAAVPGKLKALDDQVAAMVRENRRPTAEEWAAMGLRSDDAHDRIQRA